MTQGLKVNALSVGAARGCGSKSPHAGQTMTGAAAIVASLEAEGVEYIFGYPGGQAIALYDALYDSDQLKHILARHEQAAVHEADGYARATGNVGVVCVTSGPGATNTVTGIANAYLDSVPLVVITCQVPRRVIGTDAFQESDIMGITMPIVKHSFLVQSASDLPRIIREAFHIAITGRPGPVVIDVPSDVATEELVFKYPDNVNIPSYKPTYNGNAKQVKAAAKLLRAAKRPVIIAGGGVISSGAAEELAQLANALQIPVACTLMGKGAFPNNHELSLGAIGMHGSHTSNKALMDADLILAVGMRFSDRVTGDIKAFAPGAKIIHIDIDPAEIGKVKEVNVPIVGDARVVLANINEELAEGVTVKTNAWRKAIAENHQAEKAEEAEEAKEAASEGTQMSSKAASENASSIDPRFALAKLSELLDQQESIVVTEVGQHQMWAAQTIDRSVSRSFLSSGGLGAMGFGFPAAIGARLGCPSKQVVCIAGDGSLQMNIQEMATAIEVGAPVKVVLIDNSCLGMVHQWQKFFYDGRYSQTTLQANPDFIALAKAYGWEAQRVEKQENLAGAYAEMLKSDKPYLLDVVISPDCDVTPMVRPGHALSDTVDATCVKGGAHE